MPLQPFSIKNYNGSLKSFDNHWLNLAQQPSSHASINKNRGITDNLTVPLPDLIEYDATEFCYVMNLPLSQLITFFQHPSKYFAKKQLNLNFDIHSLELDDVEPFEFNSLQSYLLREQLIKAQLNEQTLSAEETEQAVQQCITAATLSGKFPEAITRDKTFESWKLDSESFSQTIQEHNAIVKHEAECTVTLELDNETSQLLIAAHNTRNEVTSDTAVESNNVNKVKVKLSTKLPISDNKLAFYRSSSPKFKDFVTLYFHQCLLNILKSEGQTNSNIELVSALQNITATHGFYFDTKSQKVTQFKYSDVVEPNTQLLKFISQYIIGLQQPLLVNGEIAEKAFKAKIFEQKEFELYWDDPNAMMSIGNDAYIHYFWPECPDYEYVQVQLEHLYAELFNEREQIK